ncbi:MAG: PEP-CTERM sorting domain-containing protein [Terriglobia bacterium]
MTIMLTAALGGFARANVVYSNAPDLSANQTGNCAYNTACGPTFTGNTYAAQEFTLSSAATVTGAGFNSVVPGGIYGTSAYYYILAANGAAGLPGTVLASGSSSLSETAGPNGYNDDTTNYSFAIPSLDLTAGTYYLAFQDVTTDFEDYLSLGVASGGDAQSNDGGTSWISGYPNIPGLALASVAISVYGTTATVPEPTTLALFGIGLLGLGIARRKRWFRAQ